MQFKRVEDLKTYLTEQCFTDTVVLESPSYVNAIIGISNDGRLIYHRERMVQYLRKQFGMTRTDAEEFIDFNTVGALPNMGDKAPIIMEELD